MLQQPSEVSADRAASLAKLLRNADAPNQAIETFIGTQRVPERFQFKIGKTSKALIVTLFEPHERWVFVFQRGINQGEVKRRYKALFGSRLEFLDRPKRLAFFPSSRLRVS